MFGGCREGICEYKGEGGEPNLCVGGGGEKSKCLDLELNFNPSSLKFGSRPRVLSPSMSKMINARIA